MLPNTLVAFLKPIFFINGAVKSATLLAHAVFASVNSKLVVGLSIPPTHYGRPME